MKELTMVDLSVYINHRMGDMLYYNMIGSLILMPPDQI